MGSSRTYHVVGQTALENGRTIEFGAMTKTEMAQEAAKLLRDEGLEVATWYAQTKTGERMIGGQVMAASEVKLPKLGLCVICIGKGCIVCNYSGICRPGNEKKWRPWQLESIRKDALAG